MKQAILSFLLVVCSAFALFFGVTFVSFDTVGTNQSNDSILAKVYVWNTEPIITMVDVKPNPIDLSAGNTTQVNCTAYVFDYNGWPDIRNVSAIFYLESLGSAGSADNNYRYINQTCANCTSADSSGTNASCLCTFNVWYYAQNGTWRCNVSLNDKGGNATINRTIKFNNTNISGIVTMNTVLGIDVPSILDYGNMSVTELSAPKPVNVTNLGNVPMNFSVRAFGGTDETAENAGNYSMFCQFGNISVGYQRYSNSNWTSYDTMINVTNTSTPFPGLTVPVRTNDAMRQNDSNTTYWRLRVPLSVGGMCNGTIIFNAMESLE